MTNRKWLESLSDEELVKQLLEKKCTRCICKVAGGNACINTDCCVATEKWLQAEHKGEKHDQQRIS